MPHEADAAAVLKVLADADKPWSTPRLETVANIRRTRLELLLKVLDVDGAVERVSGGWRSTGQPWIYDAQRYERVAQTRKAEQQAMIAYARPAESPAATCRMAFLQSSLDDPTAAACGRCDVCAGPWYPTDIPSTASAAAAARLDRPGVELSPRAQWPTAVDRLGVDARGKIAGADQVLVGRAIARLTDLGWGQRLRTLLAADDGSADQPTQCEDVDAVSVSSIDGPPDDDLLQACARVLKAWDWADRPAAIVSIPSRRRPQLVSGIARGIGELGRLPYLGQLDLAHGGPSGAPGGNSAYRLAAVWDRLVVGDGLAIRIAEYGDQPILLVDDLADSRWTMTVAGRQVRRAGAGAVLPFVLALAA